MIKFDHPIQISILNHRELGTLDKEVHAYVIHDRWSGDIVDSSCSYLVPVGKQKSKSFPGGSFFWREDVLKGWEKAEKDDRASSPGSVTIRTFTYNEKLLTVGELYIWINESYLKQTLEDAIELIKKEVYET